jgi:hypothetical protein
MTENKINILDATSYSTYLKTERGRDGKLKLFQSKSTPFFD